MLHTHLRAAQEAGLVLEARVIDFWSGSVGIRLAIICSWLRNLGFHVITTSDCSQEELACGYVAARTINLMYEAGAHFQSLDVSDAADLDWVILGNEVQEINQRSAAMLETSQV